MDVHRLNPWHALLLLPLVGVLAWVTQRGKRSTEDPGSVLRALRVAHGPVLPAAGSAGATSRTEPARYDRDSLFDLIDGAADTYLARGFVEARAAIYSFSPPGGAPIEVSAEVHRFASPSGALAQREAERPGDARAVPGLAAISDGSVLMLVIGTDLLKLTALTPEPSVAARLVDVARAFEKEVEIPKERTP